MFQVTSEEALLALAAAGVVGSVVGLGMSRFSSESRLDAMNARVLKTKELAAAAAEAANAAEEELSGAQARLSAAEVEVARLQAEVNRLPALDATVTELRAELFKASETLAAELARVERIPSLEQALDRSQHQLEESSAEMAGLQARAEQLAALESSVAQQQARLDQMQAALAAAEQEKTRLAVRVEGATTRAGEQHARLERLQATLAEAEQEKARLAVRVDEATARANEQLTRLVQVQASLAEAEQEKARLAVRVEEATARANEQLTRLGQVQASLAEAEQEKARISSRAEETTLRAGDLLVRLDQLQATLAEAEQEKARLAVRLEEAALRSQDQQSLFEARAASREAFPALSTEVLASSQQVFLDAVRTAIGEFEKRASEEQAAKYSAIELLVSPVRDTVADLRASMHALQGSQLDVHELGMNVVALQKAQTELQATADRLSRLPTPRKRAERWGEIPLRRVVELAGVAEHCHFDGPIDVATADGRLRPDAIIRLPGMRSAVIDARAPLAAYLASLEADDEVHRRSMLRVHAARMRDHASQLGSPAYRAQLPTTSDLVILYLPLEGALSGALEEDSGLIDYALGYSVLPASPLTLFAHLKTAIWLGENSDRSVV